MEKFFFVAGEASGDLHAAEVIREMKKMCPEAEIHGYGGERMKEAGAVIHFPLPDMASVGLDWIWKIFEYRRLGLQILDICREREIRNLVLVDFPGFNLRVASAGKRAGLRVLYYIIPQVWAWRTGRLKGMKRSLDLALPIFPFEKRLLENAGIPARFVGHPLVDQLKKRRSPEAIRRENNLPLSPQIHLVGLLPGSRVREVERLAPVLLECAKLLLWDFPKLHFIVPRAQTIPIEMLERHFRGEIPLTLVENPQPDLRAAFRMAIAKSGTTTLENALLGVPQVIVYKGRPIDAWIARRVIRVPWLGLVNILAEKEICPEFLQENCIPSKIVPAASALLANSGRRETMLREMEITADSLGSGGASEHAAKAILERVEP
jgi:lipid-A-disaccharide synthase